MAQPMITSFYQNRKKNADLQPSKRRKLRHTVEENNEVTSLEAQPLFQPDPPSSYSKTRGKKSSNKKENPCSVKQSDVTEVPKNVTKILEQSCDETKTSRSKSASGKKVRSTRATKKKEEVLLAKVLEDKSIERVTAVIDDHVSTPPTSPSKRLSTEDSQKEVTRKRGRKTKQIRIDHLINSDVKVKSPATEDGYAFDLFTSEPEKSAQSKSGRKKLILTPPKPEEHMKSNSPPNSDGVDGKTEVEEKVTATKKQTKKASTKSSKHATKSKRKSPEPVEEEQLVTQELPVETPIETPAANPRHSREKAKAPVAKTGEETVSVSTEPKSVEKTEAKGKTKQFATPMMDQVMAKLKAKETKNKATSVEPPMEQEKSEIKPAPSAAAVKSKLQKCGKLQKLQEHLAQMNKDVRKVKDARKKAEEAAAKLERQKNEEPKDAKNEAKAPAFERFHTLAQPVPSTLSLPYKYKLLAEMFRTADTVVSMLHNRHEVCTFNKMKQAVQQMLRRAFEQPNLGQIRQVYPAAYKYRQEKNIPNIMGRSSDYQLTVEPVLDGSDPSDLSSRRHEPFQASQLLERKTVFHTKLVDIVKRHHKEFLSRLDRPLTVPDEKLTRWHPRFPLDELPDIPAADLPEPPYVYKVQTAKVVLQKASNKYNEKVKKALENVANNSSNKSDGSSAAPVIEAKPNKPDKQLAGVSQSLLERIRAKEARTVALSMILSPQDEKRQLMMSRLPAMTRSLRSIFVTEKRPALPVDDCLKKMADSYTSAMSTTEMEKHLVLMLELVPDWVQVVKTHKGRFVKIDKNKDLTALHERIQKQMEKEKSKG